MARLNETRVAGVIADAFAIRASTSTTSSMHAQHGAALFVGLDADVVISEPGRPPVRGRAVVVPPDVQHGGVSPGPTLGMLFDPELTPQVAAFARARGRAVPLEGRLGAHVQAAAAAQRASIFRGPALAGLAREVADLFTGERHPQPDRRVARVLEVLRDPDADRREAARDVDVGDAHLRALFARTVGVPMRTFQLWHRLLRALQVYERGDATHAAHAAGFADLAHFSRTCRKMLGYAPTELRPPPPR